MDILRRIKADILARRHLDTYVATVIAIVFAALGTVGDIVPDGLKWSALFAGMAMLLFRITLPDRPGRTVDELFADRSAYDAPPLPELLTSATQLWIFGPSAINILSPQNCEAIRQRVLHKGAGDVRITVLDPDNEAAVALAVQQLDQSLLFPVQGFRASLGASVELLRTMAQWQVAGTFSYWYLDYNPGLQPGGDQCAARRRSGHRRVARIPKRINRIPHALHADEARQRAVVSVLDRPVRADLGGQPASVTSVPGGAQRTRKPASTGSAVPVT